MTLDLAWKKTLLPCPAMFVDSESDDSPEMDEAHRRWETNDNLLFPLSECSE